MFDERLEINIGGRLFDTINDLRTIDRRVEGFGLSDAAADSGAVGGMTVQKQNPQTKNIKTNFKKPKTKNSKFIPKTFN